MEVGRGRKVVGQARRPKPLITNGQAFLLVKTFYTHTHVIKVIKNYRAQTGTNSIRLAVARLARLIRRLDRASREAYSYSDR